MAELLLCECGNHEFKPIPSKQKTNKKTPKKQPTPPHTHTQKQLKCNRNNVTQ
jgi:hypothetical protein